ncbi:hypothetical protein DES52_101333 [Deinococcus yavapaiensis KR-236]|uniref:Uncharacterized protein n=1 Tax=Deinococcus yavapaiensis KR-236 TaxID=694435 RepID=A0A318SAX3_9DEIO|nr:hypothetical protein DES52_101333 [Deinococcus yavapaiensis KR-236]
MRSEQTQDKDEDEREKIVILRLTASEQRLIDPGASMRADESRQCQKAAKQIPNRKKRNAPLLSGAGPGRKSAYSFIPVVAKPSTRKRCASRYAMRAGTAAIVAVAMSLP